MSDYVWKELCSRLGQELLGSHKEEFLKMCDKFTVDEVVEALGYVIRESSITQALGDLGALVK